MLLYFLITCFSFFLFSKSLPLKPLPPWATEARLLSPFFFKSFSLSLHQIFKSLNFFKQTQSKMSLRTNPTQKSDNFSHNNNIQEEEVMSFLDLPELVLELVLERLPPSGLCSMAGVCTSLRERCVSDHLWERHMKQKWSKVLGPSAHREWQWFIASRSNDPCGLKQGKTRSFFRVFNLVRLFSSILRSKIDETNGNCKKAASSLPVDSIMNWFLALETGKFWFPAQVYNRENGHVGFMLSCYDAELSYDLTTDTFQARYPPHGRRAVAIENNVGWERLRAPPVDTPPHDLHVTDCLHELSPGDHFEIQWRRNKEFPYGWWYGIIGHLESCDGNLNYCRCHQSDTVVLEFNQYTPGSRWRHTTVSRRDHREEGNEADGFYGGIRKLKTNDEIATWKQLWPTSVLE